MSGLEIPGLAVGGVSFFFQAFAGCIQGYELIADACRLEKDYQNLLIKVKIEEHRLFDWARSVGLDYTDERLVLNHMSKSLIMGIMEQQQKLLFSFGRLDKKYAKLASPLLVERSEAFDFNAERLLENGAKTQAIRFPQTDDLLQKVRIFTEQLKTAPRRLKWASLDKDKAERLVADLVHFNDKLNEALDRAQRDSLREEQIRTTYQIVLLNRTVENMMQLIQSQRAIAPPLYRALTWLDDSEYGLFGDRPIARDPDTQPLAALAQFKAVNLQIEESDGMSDIDDSFAMRINLNHSVSDLRNPRIELEDICPQGFPEDIDESRTEWQYDGKSVWIEWKTVELNPGYAYGTYSTTQERISKLAALLKEMNKTVRFRAPECLGYFEDEENGRFGFVFAKPASVPEGESPTTLRSLLDTDMPPLASRLTLMRLISETIERLHAVDWLHKGLRSANILFFNAPLTTTANISNPYISGFEYSRPATRADMTQRPSADPAADIYRHPKAQSEAHKAGFLKTFDLYSLGLVLLEIAYWKPVDQILGIPDIDNARPKDTYAARQRLLEDPQFRKYVRGHLGEAAESIVWACLQGPEGFGLPEGCDEGDSLVGARLQWEFGERVVKRLAGMKGL